MGTATHAAFHPAPDAVGHPAAEHGDGPRQSRAVATVALTAAGRRPRLVAAGATVGFIAVWGGLGLLLDAGITGSLLLGVLLSAFVHTGVRRRPLRALWSRDSASFARRWPGKVFVAAVLLTIPTLMAFQSLREDRYADNSWAVLLMAVVLALGYVMSRRVVVTVTIAAAAVGFASWVLAPDLATAHSGDRSALSHLAEEHRTGMLSGLHDIAVAEVDLGAPQSVRLAGIGADAETPMEVGSITKAMTGLVIADAAARGEVRMDVPVSAYLPQLAGSPAGAVTLHELVTHTAGYRDFGAATLRRGAWSAPLGRNFLTTSDQQMTQEIRDADLATRGTFVYSNLGAATAGQAVAAAAGMSYHDLMRTRLFEPLAMTHTTIQDDHAIVAGGQSRTGLPVRPWVFGAYAPAGAAVSTAGDLAKLAAALLDGTAPGTSALEPTTATGDADTRIGDFWATTPGQTGQTITWHDGQTGGYASYLGLDRAHHRAVIVLSDVANPATTDLGVDLLVHHR